MSAHTARVRVRYAETDQMGVVYHANYIVWMEVGRVELCRARGIAYKDIEQRAGIRLAVIEASCRYVAPARYDDEVDIETSIVKATPRGVEFGYIMRHGTSGQLLAEGRTRHLFLGHDLRPTKLPPAFHGQFAIA
ncbi:MAG: acyl-CoA thioesterase [Acidobacteria bacterium]|nr:acyl-CoA thioesterase [Acidobacteriota bacterium]